MIGNNQPAPKNLGLLEAALFEAAKKASSLLEPRSLGVLVQETSVG